MSRQPARKRVLVVDDDASIRLLVEAVLVPAGFEVAEADSGEKALRMFEASHADIVLLDVLMPGSDGYETCRSLRALPGGDTVPVLVMTGLDDAESIDRAYAAGATDFLGKPINWASLAHRVRYAVRYSDTFDELARKERQLSHAQRLALLGSFEWTMRAAWTQASPEACRILGVDPGAEEIDLQTLARCVHQSDVVAARSWLAEVLLKGRTAHVDLRIVRPDGTLRFVHVQAEPVRARAGSPATVRGVIQDVTERKLFEDRIRRLALVDSLTGLPNRKYLRDYLDVQVNRSIASGTRFATLFLDLDRFKRINDSLGHSAGDKLLCEASARLTRVLRTTDWVLHAPRPGPASEVARLGGDEFTIVLHPISDKADVARVAQRVLEALSAPYFLDGYETTVTASLGVAVFPDDGATAEALLRNADTAMYAAKERGKNTFEFFRAAMNSNAHDRLFYETELRRALNRNEFILHYQPRVKSSTGRVVGLEALMRWSHPLRGTVPPGDFIPAAEESGLIVGMTQWALQEACRTAKLLNARTGRPLRVAVNISAACLRQANFVEMVEQAIEQARMPAELLELEVTESLFLNDLDGALKSLLQIKSAGVTIALDDFGTGYSSLSYLRRLPVDVVKIDRSFVAGIGVDQQDTAMVAAIVAMTSKLGLPVVAEGVETQGQAEFLRGQGCQEMQGYLFGRPVEMHEALDNLLAVEAMGEDVQTQPASEAASAAAGRDDSKPVAAVMGIRRRAIRTA